MNKAPAPVSGEQKSVDSLDHCRASFSSLGKLDLALGLALATVAASILLPGLGRESLANWDEAIYGVIARNLLSRPGLTLYYAGQPWFEKPPFLFWLMAASSSFFGMTEFALRLPSAFFGIGAIALQYFAARRLSGRVNESEPSGVMQVKIKIIGEASFVSFYRLCKAMNDMEEKIGVQKRPAIAQCRPNMPGQRDDNS